jgi:PAC2 family
MMADRETDSSNRVERTTINLISTNKTIRLNDAIMIAGFPGPGLVGSMSVSYIIEQQKMHQIGFTAEDIQGQDLCTDVIRQGVAQFCESTDFATFDIQKCEEARIMTDTYLGVAEAFYG